MNMSAPVAVVLPVKPPADGKSRLRVPGVDRTVLAAAFALDTASAALATPGVLGVLVLCDDPRFARDLGLLGCAVVPDAVAGNLNATLAQGAVEAVRRWPAALPVALLADLPALDCRDLGAALAAGTAYVLAGGSAFVADTDGTGTVLYTSSAGQFDPRFGEDSARRHLAAGAHAITGELATLRRDVDDIEALGTARRLGVGPRTAALLDSAADEPGG